MVSLSLAITENTEHLMKITIYYCPSDNLEGLRTTLHRYAEENSFKKILVKDYGSNKYTDIDTYIDNKIKNNEPIYDSYYKYKGFFKY